MYLIDLKDFNKKNRDIWGTEKGAVNQGFNEWDHMAFIRGKTALNYCLRL